MIPTLTDPILDAAARAVPGRLFERYSRAHMSALCILEGTPGALGFLALANLLRYVRNGYIDGFAGDPDYAGAMPCYASVEEWLYDLYPDLPWDETIVVAIEAILEHDRFAEVQEFFARVYSFDLKAELDQAVAEVRGGGVY